MQFTFNIEPVAMARPRVVKRGRFTHAFIPKKQKDFMSAIQALVKQQYQVQPITNQPLQVTLTFYRSMPKAFSQKKQAQAEAKQILPLTKPDVDNYFKIIIDACNGLIWADDNLIVSVHAMKYYSHHPRIEMEVKPYEI